MGEFGFGVRAESTSCPELLISVQPYKHQVPIEFKVSTNFGTPTIRFNDETALFVWERDGKYEYELVVSKKALAKVRKQYED